MKLHPLPAFQDNYLWLMQDEACALVVDPGDAQVVLDGLRTHAATLDAILVTHHHPDHIGGLQAVREATGARVFAPASEAIPGPATPVRQGDTAQAATFRFSVYDVPGHTAGHVAYYGADAPGGPVLFCGDTLFSAGCGRLFEGTAAQMLASLDALAALPDATRVCCAHEYTLSNLRFARAADPDNAELAAHEQHCIALRAQGRPTLPSTLGLERRINPFLRSRAPALVAAAHAFNGADPQDEVAVFAALRQWKNEFR